MSGMNAQQEEIWMRRYRGEGRLVIVTVARDADQNDGCRVASLKDLRAPVNGALGRRTAHRLSSLSVPDDSHKSITTVKATTVKK